MNNDKIELEDIKIVSLSKLYDLSEFDCGDSDLNEFLQRDSFKYQKQLLTKIFLIIVEENVVGFFSISNDAIKLKQEERDTNNIKHLQEYPASKIGRLGVDKRFQKRNIGRAIIKIAIGLILSSSKYSACRFVIVDSYPTALEFYKKFGFVINEHSKYKKKIDFISMRYDLLNPQVPKE
tara:strand:- start:869 stop:1405 length:537 start_codon:yes stop_codon:yes gene_type:complete